MYHNSSFEISLEGSRVKPVRNKFSRWKVENGNESDKRYAFIKNLKIAFLANSWMAKTVVKDFEAYRLVGGVKWLFLGKKFVLHLEFELELARLWANWGLGEKG